MSIFSALPNDTWTFIPGTLSCLSLLQLQKSLISIYCAKSAGAGDRLWRSNSQGNYAQRQKIIASLINAPQLLLLRLPKRADTIRGLMRCELITLLWLQSRTSPRHSSTKESDTERWMDGWSAHADSFKEITDLDSIPWTIRPLSLPLQRGPNCLH